MGNRWLAIAALAACSACTEVRSFEAPPVEAEDGSRLIAEYFELDGMSVFRRWHDLERGEACRFDATPEPDGGYHCFPADRIDFDPTAHTWFEDAACTVPLFSVAEWPVPLPVLSRPRDACAEPPRLFTQGEPRYFAFYYRLSAEGDCFGEDIGAEYRPLGAEIPAASFVRAEAVVDDVAEGVGRATLVAEDGARQLGSAIDMAFGDRVEARDVVGGRRFAPTQIAFDFRNADVLGPGLYADAGCQRAVASKIARSASCPITSVLVYGEFQGCEGYPETFARAGAVVSGDALHALDAAGSCTPSPRAGNDSIFVETMEPRETSPAAMRWLGGERILRRWDTTLGGRIIVPDMTSSERFFDTAWDVSCAIAPDARGVDRCLPVNVSGLGSYADASCTEPVLIWVRSESCDAWLDPPKLIVQQETREVFAVDRRIPADGHFHIGPSGCEPVGALNPEVARLYTLEAVPETEFVRATTLQQ